MRAFIKKTQSALWSVPVFILRNLYCARDLVPFPSASFGAVAVEPLARTRLAAAEELYASLNQGARLRFLKVPLWFFGRRLCLVARRIDSNELVGMVIYYFNARDRREGMVHEGYIGLRKAERNAGLGTFMRRHALENFVRSGRAGVSSRISADNLASLKSNKNLGFVRAETYIDTNTGEKRHYLVCDLRNRRPESRFPHAKKRTVR